MLALIPKPTKIVNIGTSANVDLSSSAGSPYYPVSLICFVSGNITSSNTSPAFTTGSYAPGSYIFVRNSGTITGYAGTDGTLS